MIAKEEKDKRETQVMVIIIRHMTRFHFSDQIYFFFFFVTLSDKIYWCLKFDVIYIVNGSTDDRYFVIVFKKKKLCYYVSLS